MTSLPLRQFGGMFCVVFAILAFWFHASQGLLGLFALLTAITAGISVLRPSLLTAPTRLWLRFGGLLHRVVNPVVLAVMYLILIVPAGWLRRALGGDPMARCFDHKCASYWIACAPRTRTLDDFRQQF